MTTIAPRTIHHPDYADDRQAIADLVDALTNDPAHRVRVNADGTLGAITWLETLGDRTYELVAEDYPGLSHSGVCLLREELAGAIIDFTLIYQSGAEVHADGSIDYWLVPDGR